MVEEQAEIKKEITEPKTGGIRNFWMISTVVLAVLLLVLIFFQVRTTGFAVAGGISKDAAGNKVADFFKTYQGVDVTISSVKEESGMYAVSIDADGRKGVIYVSKDGAMIGSMSNLAQLEQESGQETQTQEIPKTDKPTVELYVMSFCPYGIQAENAMKPVYDLLKGKADFKIRFIANVGGTTVDSVQSLHGANEAKEDLRQLCIAKNYPTLFWSYVSEIDSKCSLSDVETCWKTAALKFDIDTAKIEKCAYSDEGINLLKADGVLTDKYGVSGSPTLMINGVKYNGGRGAEEYKQAICDAFNTAPSECSQVLSSTTTTASGNC
ncbi:hypothetical protein HZA33_04435 [Candidatus Pacearchaeota archaeon]|nr:hypothetical protein [Candidatus Pacearchaeota archaeon]